MKDNGGDGGKDKKKTTPPPPSSATVPPPLPQPTPPLRRIHEEECPVCLDTLPVDARTLSRMTCCGKAMHTSCYEGIKESTMSLKQKNNCPLCRTRFPSTDKEQLKRTRKWVEKGAAWAQSALAAKYHFGELGLTQSYDKAIQLLKMAIAQGDPHSMFILGNMYDRGHGFDQSYERALALFRMAADLGHASAQYNLGSMYANGQGVDQSYALAREWLTKAAEQGHEKAIAWLYKTG